MVYVVSATIGFVACAPLEPAKLHESPADEVILQVFDSTSVALQVRVTTAPFLTVDLLEMIDMPAGGYETSLRLELYEAAFAGFPSVWHAGSAASMS